MQENKSQFETFRFQTLHYFQFKKFVSVYYTEFYRAYLFMFSSTQHILVKLK